MTIWLQTDIDTELQTRIATFVRTVPDYEEVCDRVPHTPLPPHVANFLMISPFTIILGYRLTKRLDLLDWILGLVPEKAAQALAYLTSMIQLDLSMLDTFGPDLQWFINTESFWDGCSVELIEAVIEPERFAWSVKCLPIPFPSDFRNDNGARQFLNYMASQAFRNSDETVDRQPLAEWMPTHRPN